MNNRGALFTIDFVIALTLFVFILGSIYSYIHYFSNDVYEKKEYVFFQNSFDIVLDYLSVNGGCILVDSQGQYIKKIPFCINTDAYKHNSDFDFNYAIKINNQYYPNNPQFLDGVHISKSYYMLVTQEDISKADYFKCMNNEGCGYRQEVVVYVAR